MIQFYFISELETTNQEEFDEQIGLNDGGFDSYAVAWKKAKNTTQMIVKKNKFPKKIELSKATLPSQSKSTWTATVAKAIQFGPPAILPNSNMSFNVVNISGKDMYIGEYGKANHIRGHSSTIIRIVHNILTKLEFGFVIAQKRNEEVLIIPYEEVIPLYRFEEYFLKLVYCIEIDIQEIRFARENIQIVVPSEKVGDYRGVSLTNTFLTDGRYIYSCKTCSKLRSKSGCSKSLHLFIRNGKIYARVTGKHEEVEVEEEVESDSEEENDNVDS